MAFARPWGQWVSLTATLHPTHTGAAVGSFSFAWPLKAIPHLNLQARVAPHASSDPANGQTAQHRCRPAPTRAEHGLGVGDRSAAVDRPRLTPTQRVTSTRTLARHHLPQRAGLGQATDAAAVARRAKRRLGRRFGVDVDDLVHTRSPPAQNNRTAKNPVAAPKPGLCLLALAGGGSGGDHHSAHDKFRPLHGKNSC